MGEVVGVSADMWSFGTVLWELCTRERLESRSLRPLKVPQEGPQAVAVLIERCRAITPSERPTATQAYDELRAAMIS